MTEGDLTSKGGSGARAAYETWHRSLPASDPEPPPWVRMIRSELVPARDLAGKRVLEIGCGRGDFARWLTARSEPPKLLVAADFAVSAVAAGRRTALDRSLHGIAWQVGDIGAIALPDASVDTVFSLETIEHCPAPARAVAELGRVLAPGGRLFLTTPNYLNFAGLYRVYLRLRGRRFSEAGQPINHPVLLPRTRAWVRRAGLRVIAVRSTGHPIPLPGGAIDFAFLDRLGPLTRWLGIQSMVVAEKPGR